VLWTLFTYTRCAHWVAVPTAYSNLNQEFQWLLFSDAWYTCCLGNIPLEEFVANPKTFMCFVLTPEKPRVDVHPGPALHRAG
jgi:hypothetical protein